MNFQEEQMIVFENVTKNFPNGTNAVSDISFKVKKGETLVILGTSGCGKTTTMKMINRLIDPTSGKIFVNGQDIMSVDPIQLRRQIGYAIQHIGLFNYMTVEENISIVPKLLKWEEKKIKQRVSELLELVGFHPKEIIDRFPNQLSGGQRQRIGVARALAQDPPIILMDEPFGALDPITREQIQKDFIELESNIQKTIIFVTHDVSEAIKMGDRIALLDKGKIMQIGSPSDLLENPSNEFVLNFFSQHRFQLILQTKQIKEFFTMRLEGEEEKIAPTFPSLSVKHTFFEALDIFNETQKTVLPVFEKRKFIGQLQKKDLLKAIIEILQEKDGVVNE